MRMLHAMASPQPVGLACCVVGRPFVVPARTEPVPVVPRSAQGRIVAQYDTVAGTLVASCLVENEHHNNQAQRSRVRLRSRNRMPNWST